MGPNNPEQSPAPAGPEAASSSANLAAELAAQPEVPVASAEAPIPTVATPESVPTTPTAPEASPADAVSIGRGHEATPGTASAPTTEASVAKPHKSLIDRLLHR